MRRLVLLLLPLTACAPDLPPEQIAAARAEALVRRTRPDATLLAPLAGLDGEGRPGVCGLIETRAGPVRVVAALASGEVRTGVPATQGGHRLDLGESRYCSEDARKRWDQLKRIDPVGLTARVEGDQESLTG